jgi:hypothetical protein
MAELYPYLYLAAEGNPAGAADPAYHVKFYTIRI